MMSNIYRDVVVFATAFGDICGLWPTTLEEMLLWLQWFVSVHLKQYSQMAFVDIMNVCF